MILKDFAYYSLGVPCDIFFNNLDNDKNPETCHTFTDELSGWWTNESM